MMKIILAVFSIFFLATSNAFAGAIDLQLVYGDQKTKDAFSAYLKDVATQIGSNWNPPMSKKFKQFSTTTFDFVIDGNGKLIAENLLQSSGNSLADAAVQVAIRTTKFIAPPVSPPNGLLIHACFNNTLAQMLVKQHDKLDSNPNISDVDGSWLAPYFSLDSSIYEVERIQGEPDAVTNNGCEQTWNYGASTVTFVDRRLVGYVNADKNLRLRP